MKLEMISKYPVESQHRTSLLFVHGTLHGAWCWDVHFLEYFAQHGYAAHAINLRGHGNSEGRGKLRWTRIADYVEDVVKAVRQLPLLNWRVRHSFRKNGRKNNEGLFDQNIYTIVTVRPWQGVKWG